jgi:hypothetical protein
MQQSIDEFIGSSIAAVREYMDSDYIMQSIAT